MANDYLKTGSRKIDDLLSNGLELGEITHFFGETGSGKTTIALQSTVESIKNNFVCVYVATNRFPRERLRQLLAPDLDLAKHLLVYEANDYREQKEAVFQLDEIKETNKSLGLVVIDGLTSFYHPSSVDEEERFDLKKELSNQLIHLVAVARKRGFSVLVTNQVYKDRDIGEHRSRGGRLVNDISKKNIELKKKNESRGLAILRKPSFEAIDSKKFEITDEGLI